MLTTLENQTITQWRPEAAARSVLAVAEQVRDAFAAVDLPMPLLAAQTHFSVHESILSPADWEQIRAALGQDQRILLADVGDLSAYPSCRRHWGPEHFAIGAQFSITGSPNVLCLVSDAQGFKHLSHLCSQLHANPQYLKQWAAGQISPPDCSGLIVLLQDVEWLRLLREAGAEVYWRCGIGSIHGLSELAAPSGIPLVAAPICAFASSAERHMQAVLQALRHNGRVSASAQIPQTDNALSDLLRMPHYYRNHRAVIERGRELLARCTFHPATDIHFPPSNFADPDAELRRLSERGLILRYGESVPQQSRQRLEFELEVVRIKHFASYILTVYDLVQQRRTCGRGSATSSIICYVLGLTNVDPIRYHLVFERFLAPEREDPPDIDLDFPWDERDAVFAAAISRYGREHVAMVCTHLHYRKWSALREVARVHGQKRQHMSAIKHQLSRMNRFGGSMELAPPWQRIFTEARLLLGAPRHYGLHPGGLIITECPIADIVPTHPSKKIISGQAFAAIAWEKDGAEELGLLKIDILGNRSLAVIRDTIADLREDGIALNEERWCPQDDLATRRIIAEGGTMGCFYIESPAMRQLNAKAGSGEFDRIIVHSSIVRPAANKWIRIYLERLHEYNRSGIMKDEWFAHPVLRSLLSESFGVMSYQEDVMLVAKELAGFVSRQQNYLRKSLGRTDSRERLQKIEQEFYDGCQARGISDTVRDLSWSMIISFSGYSFTKAHSASYAMVSFQCAYLKVHHPAYFLARVIANGGGFYSRSAYVEEARRMGIRIGGPCVLRSVYATRHEQGGQAIRLGLHCVPLVQLRHAQRIEQEMKRRAFQSFTDFHLRCHISRRECDSLERAGAFNLLLKPYHQTQRRWIIDAVFKVFPKPSQSEPAFISYVATYGFEDPHPPLLAQAATIHIWQERYAHIGCLPYEHPLHLWPLPNFRLRCKDITIALKDQRVELVAWSITAKQVRAEQKKDLRGRVLSEPISSLMCFATLEDPTGLIETTWFPRAYQRFGALLDIQQPLCIEALVQVEFGMVSLIVEGARLIGEG